MSLDQCSLREHGVVTSVQKSIYIEIYTIIYSVIYLPTTVISIVIFLNTHFVLLFMIWMMINNPVVVVR